MKCAWASIDENGRTHGGKAGDQTWREVKIGDYYNFGQTIALRPKDAMFAYWIAEYARDIANNSNVGYDQYQRKTLFDITAATGWQKTTVNQKCECDCSELAVCAINYAAGHALLSASVYSGNIVAAAMKTGKFNEIKITKSYSPKQGDIVVRPGHHVIIVIGSVTKPGTSKPAAAAAPNIWAVGKTYTCRENMNVRTGAGTSYRKKKVSEVTADARKHCVNKSVNAYAVLKAGTRVTCKKVVKAKNGYVWLQIPSGYVCAYNGSKKYVY